MITAALNLFSSILDLLPEVNMDFLNSWNTVKGVIIDILTGLGCLVPLGSLMPLLFVTIGIQSVRLVLAVLLRIKSFIPFIGGG